MLQFKVSGMTCGGCAASVTRAIKRGYPSASVDVDLPRQIIKVDALEDPASVARLIEGAGFPVLEKLHSNRRHLDPLKKPRDDKQGHRRNGKVQRPKTSASSNGNENG